MTRDELSAAAIATYDGAGGASLTAKFAGLIAGTRVATPTGEVAVEKLSPGDLVLTHAGRPARVTRTARRSLAIDQVAMMPAAQPVRLDANALGPMLPRQALLLAPDQTIIVGEVTATAAALVNGGSIRRTVVSTEIVCVSVRLDAPRAILAQGLACATTPMRNDLNAMLLLRAKLAKLAGLSPGPLHGQLANLSHAGAQGWVLDRSHPTVPVGLELVIDGKVLARTLADRRRPDLEMAGLGGCGFVLRLNQSLTAERHYIVHVRRIDDGAEVPGSPHLLTRATGDAWAVFAGLSQQMSEACNDTSRDALAVFLAEQITELAQANLERKVCDRD